jgi:hypothetical protein
VKGANLGFPMGTRPAAEEAVFYARKAATIRVGVSAGVQPSRQALGFGLHLWTREHEEHVHKDFQNEPSSRQWL